MAKQRLVAWNETDFMPKQPGSVAVMNLDPEALRRDNPTNQKKRVPQKEPHPKAMRRSWRFLPRTT